MSDIEHNFSLDDFKKWMRKHDDEPKMERQAASLVGITVEAKVSARKIAEKMQTEDGDTEELAIEFVNYGGTILDVDGKNFLIEVDSGTFHILRNYVRRA